MEIKKTITIDLKKEGKNLICTDLPTLSMMMGTTSVSGNYHIYGIKKDKNKFIVPIKKLDERISVLEERRNKISSRLDIMKQVRSQIRR